MTISIPDLEQRAALGWRAPEEERLGDWLLRAVGGFTGRANSALAVGDPGRPPDRAAGAVRDWYEARGLPAMICIPYPAGRPQAVPLDRLLAEQGWGIRSGAATVMAAPAAQLARAAGPVAAVAVAVDPEPDQAWLALYHYRGQQQLPPIATRVLTSAPWQAFASIRADGQTIAIGRVAAAAGWAGLTAIEVAPRTGAAGSPPPSRPPSRPGPPHTVPGTSTSRSRTTTRPPARCTSASASPRTTAITTASPRRARTPGRCPAGAPFIPPVLGKCCWQAHRQRGKEHAMAVSAFQDYPLADRDREWDGAAAEKRIRAWADAEDEPNAQYRDAHVWYDSDNKDNFTAYKLLIADVIDGKVHAVPRAVMAAGNVMQGSRGGIDLPKKDIDRVKSHLAKYYQKMGEEAPWERG